MPLILFLYCYFRVIQLLELSRSFQIAISDLVEEVSKVIRRFLDTWQTSKELKMVTSRKTVEGGIIKNRKMN